MNYINNVLELTLEAAPWLVLGLFIGGMMKALLPTSLLEKHLKGRGLGSIIKAAILGAPLPLCSCGVIPAALGLRQAGASKPATVSFLVSTPETGVDSITVTYALMGWFMAIVRPIAALSSAIVSGILVGLLDKTESKPSSENIATSCCSTKPSHSDKTEEVTCCSSTAKNTATTSCCSSAENYQESHCCSDTSNTKKQGFMQKACSGIQYAFTDLLDGILLWLVIGLFFAAAVKTFLPTDFLTQWGSGLPAMLIMVAAGIPMYICATASTPIAAGLMLAGVSPGTALVLLLTGPATNISTLGVIRKELGKKTVLYYLFGTVITALASGLFIDWLVNQMNIDIQMQLNAGIDSLPNSMQWVSLLLLILLPLRKLLPISIRR